MKAALEPASLAHRQRLHMAPSGELDLDAARANRTALGAASGRRLGCPRRFLVTARRASGGKRLALSSQQAPGTDICIAGGEALS
jgi:hypothetical protein